MQTLFGFHLPTRIEFGNGLIKQTGRLTRNLIEGKKALLVTDPGIRKVGIADTVAESLTSEGYEIAWFDQVQPNPKDRDCEQGGQIAREFGAHVIIAVGGGSVLDSAKAIALLHTHDGRVQDYQGRGKVIDPVTPIVAIPTTAGTGSEVTRSAVITDTEQKFKMTVKDVKLAPSLAIIDPETTYALPAHITASTGMDAFVHAIEAYTCKAANPMSDMAAETAMQRIFPSLRMSVMDSSNRKAKTDMMLGSLLAGIAFSHADVAAVHCMAEALGGLYDTPHGVANSMFLPIVTAYNAPANLSKHARVAKLCGLQVSGLSDEEAADLLVRELTQLSKDIGIPCFSSLDYVNPADFNYLAESSYRNGSTPNNCREIGKEDYLQLFHDNFSIKA